MPCSPVDIRERVDEIADNCHFRAHNSGGTLRREARRGSPPSLA